MKKPLREFVDWLDAQGLKPEVVSQKNHVRIRLTHPTMPDTEVVLIAPASGSDWRGIKNSQARVKRFIREGHL